jgi:hypothetical protein
LQEARQGRRAVGKDPTQLIYQNVKIYILNSFQN